MKLEICSILHNIVHKLHDRWQKKHGFAYNNEIIDLLRNRLSNDAQEWFETYITRRKMKIPKKYLCHRDPSADLAFRRFKGEFRPKPCEICGFDRAPSIAHIIPKAVGGSDDDWNLIHLCANHHYLFDRGLLTSNEWQSIHWHEKGVEAKYFTDHVRLKQHQKCWDNI